MMRKINCKWNNQGVWCKNKKVKRSLFGFGTRCCMEYNSNKVCQLKELRPKPVRFSPCPPRKVIPKIIIIN